jgi:outer membrane protein assembly factor BamA
MTPPARRNVARLPVLLASVALAVQFALCGPAAASSPRHLVRAIELDGNASVSSTTLLGLMDTRVDKPFDRARLNADIRKIDGYYDAHGFGGQLPTHVLAASFDTATGALQLHIREGLTVRRVFVDYDPVVPRALLLEALATRSDEVYSDQLRQDDLQGVSELFARHGLTIGSFAGGVDVRSVDPILGQADVHYSIAVARVGAIAIDGNVRVADATIRKKLGLRLGDLVTQAALDRALQRLDKTHRFAWVDVVSRPGPDPSEPSRITLLWRVKERG